MKYEYNDLLSRKRVRPSSVKRQRNIDDFYSDRSRILYCSSFRRLQQKAQVFSMETNSSVRSRLTHSLEVSDLGRTLANDIGYKLKADRDSRLSSTNIPALVAVVENACLLHDIGNPPFGHFGEAAIQDWAKHEAQGALPADVVWDERLQKLMKDFEEFDGNPQGFRTVTKLHCDVDEHGLNLTYATLLCGLKYARAAGDPRGKGILKKAGWFQTEQALVERIFEEMGLTMGTRYPLTYIMEAADDIAYCMSDIADGIEKRILTEEEFLRTFTRAWLKKYDEKSLKALKLPDVADLRNFSQDFSVGWAKKAMQEAVKNYMDHHEEIYAGTAGAIIDEADGTMGKVLETIKAVSREVLYPSIEAESIELTGYAVITGILHKYQRMLKMEYADFRLVAHRQGRSFAVEQRLFNRIGNRCVQAYRKAVEALDERDPAFAQKEWWLRVHLVVDHISSMTDAFALETYQMLEGIALMRT